MASKRVLYVIHMLIFQNIKYILLQCYFKLLRYMFCTVVMKL